MIAQLLGEVARAIVSVNRNLLSGDEGVLRDQSPATNNDFLAFTGVLDPRVVAFSPPCRDWCGRGHGNTRGGHRREHAFGP